MTSIHRPSRDRVRKPAVLTATPASADGSSSDSYEVNGLARRSAPNTHAGQQVAKEIEEVVEDIRRDMEEYRRRQPPRTQRTDDALTIVGGKDKECN